MAKKKKEEKPREYTRRQLSHFQKQKRRQRIIFISGVSIIVAIVLVVMVGWYIAEFRPLHRTLIQVGDTEFNTAYYIDALKTYYKIYQQTSTGQDIQTLDASLPDYIIQGELIRQAAKPLGITVSDEDVKKTVQGTGQTLSAAYMDILRTQELGSRLKDEYFGTQVVPLSESQVHMMAMMVESLSVANEVRDKLVNGENFTAMAEQYAQDAYSKTVKGDFGMHPREILDQNIASAVPLDFAFAADVGAISPPLADNATYKSLGYWLIDVLDRPFDNEATVNALYLGSREEALGIKAKLEAGDNLTAIADQYSQYPESKEKHGELGVITTPTDNTTTAVSAAFDAYVFDPATELGKWSDPIPDTTFYTQGGYWLVQVIEKDADAKLSDTDRTSLIDKAYTSWAEDLFQHSATAWISVNRASAIARAEKDLGQTGG